MSEYQTEHAQQVQQAKQTQTAPDLEAQCREAAETEGDIVIASREFPDEAYKYAYSRVEISIVRARLQMQGFAFDTKIVMGQKCSRLIWTVQRNTCAEREVHAEKLAKEPTVSP
jgi:hypothetical protein